jgi:FkbM family methyltransferase
VRRLRRSLRARRISWRIASLRRFTPYAAVVQDEAVVLVATGAGDYVLKLAARGVTSDAVVLDRAVDLLRERGMTGSTFLDVGAHIGTTTLRAALHHGFRHVVAFEPDPDNARILAANVALNGLRPVVEVVEAAVGRTTGRAPFNRGPRRGPGRLTGRGSLAEGDPESESIEVQLTTLDSWLALHSLAAEDVALLWIDVQGSELAVLAGASELVASRVPLVFALRPGRVQASADDWLERLRISGYETYVDLRQPALYRLGWKPLPAPIAGLRTLVAQGRGTDVLVVATERAHHERTTLG